MIESENKKKQGEIIGKIRYWHQYHFSTSSITAITSQYFRLYSLSGAPGQATSYIIGQQTIIRLRNRVKDGLGDDYDIKDFHYQILSQAQSPFDFVSIYLDKYVKCKKDKNYSTYCTQILSGNEKKKKSEKRYGVIRTPKEEKIKGLFQMFKRRKHA